MDEYDIERLERIRDCIEDLDWKLKGFMPSAMESILDDHGFNELDDMSEIIDEICDKYLK